MLSVRKNADIIADDQASLMMRLLATFLLFFALTLCGVAGGLLYAMSNPASAQPVHQATHVMYTGNARTSAILQAYEAGGYVGYDLFNLNGRLLSQLKDGPDFASFTVLNGEMLTVQKGNLHQLKLYAPGQSVNWLVYDQAGRQVGTWRIAYKYTSSPDGADVYEEEMQTSGMRARYTTVIYQGQILSSHGTINGMPMGYDKIP